MTSLFLTWLKLWDVCSDQEAVDLIRHNPDPQAASKILVEHALSRFSTDNLSCMVIRFNNRALQDHAERRSTPIGVEGDPPSYLAMTNSKDSAAISTGEVNKSDLESKRTSGISETEAIVGAARKGMPAVAESDVSAADLSRVSTDMIVEEEQAEPGPELDPEGLDKAKEKAKEGKEKETEAGAHG